MAATDHPRFSVFKSRLEQLIESEDQLKCAKSKARREAAEHDYEEALLAYLMTVDELDDGPVHN
jgi:hypothetical protein